MAQNIFASLLFFSLLLSTCYGVSPQCVAFNATTVANANTTSSGFTLSVSPGALTDNTLYNVTVNGSGNFTVTLVALSPSTPIGNWSGCISSIQFVNAFQNASAIQTNWTSPTNLTSVTINAYLVNIDQATQIYVISKALSPATVTSTPASVNSTSATAIKATTSTGSKNHPSLTAMAVIQISFLLMISKFLS